MSDVSFEALNYITSIVVQTYFETAFKSHDLCLNYLSLTEIYLERYGLELWSWASGISL